MITFFTLFIFWLFHTFLYKWVFFRKNTQNLSESMFLLNIIFKNSLAFIKGEFLYKVRTKLHNKITCKIAYHDNTYFNVLIQSIWFKTKNTESIERRKISFPKETVENADLHKAVLNKTMTTQEKCVKIRIRSSFNVHIF